MRIAQLTMLDSESILAHSATSLTPVRSSRQHINSFWKRIAWLEPFWLLALAPSLLFPGRFWVASAQPLLVLLLFLFWPLRRLAYGRLTAETPLNVWVAVLTLWLPLTVWISISRAQSWIAVGYLVLGIAIFFALVNWPPARKQPALLILPILAGGLLLALMGPLLIDVGAGSRLFRVAQIDARLGLFSDRLGEEVNPNVIAGALVMIVPPAIALLLEPRWTMRRSLPLLCGLTGLLCLLSLVITQSRGAYLSTAVAGLLLVILRWPKLAWLVPVLAAGAAAFVWRLGFAAILDQLSSDTSLAGLSGRLEIWERAAWALQDFVFTGVGHGLFDPVVSTLYPFFLLPSDIPHAHNLVLQIGVDMGLVGIFAYLGVVLTVMFLAGRTLSRTGSAPAADDREAPIDTSNGSRAGYLTWALAAGGLASITGMMVHGIVDAVTWGTKLTFIPWMVYALVVLVHQGPRRRQRRRHRKE